MPGRLDPGGRIRDIVTDMLEKTAMTAAELAERLERARDIGYWRNLSPELSVDGSEPAPPTVATDAELRTAAAQFQTDHYFQTPPLFGATTLASLNRAIDVVTAAGWPAEFALVYDSLWHCARLPAIGQLLESHFGAGYSQIPHVWIHVVPPISGAVGWMPHFDGFRPARLSVWVAFTDATVDNGCIHIVPPDVLPPAFRTTDLEVRLAMRDVLKAMHGTRALPVPAGAALGWEFDVFHWGGRAVHPREARRSMSMVFLAAGQTPETDETPLIAVDGPLPSFTERLRVVAVGLRAYAEREAASRRYRALADRLLT